MTDQAVYHLYRGRLPSGVEVLVTIYPDGTGELAHREPTVYGTWGPPVVLQHIEGVPVEDVHCRCGAPLFGGHCGHCHDDPPADHVCPVCGKAATAT